MYPWGAPRIKIKKRRDCAMGVFLPGRDKCCTLWMPRDEEVKEEVKAFDLTVRADRLFERR